MTDTSEIAPEAQAALDRAQAQWDARNLAAALDDCDQALQLAPHWAHAHNLRGMVLDDMGRDDEAAASYQQALRLDPTLTDAADNLAELQRERGVRRSPWKRAAAIALPVVILAAVVVTVALLQSRRGPDWRLTLNEYIAQRAQSQEVVTAQKVVTADHPASFVPEMGTLMPGGVQWEGINPVFPPQAVQCVVLATSAAKQRQVVYVAYHSDGLHHIGWRVYEAQQAPFGPELMADLQTIGCHLPPD